MTQTLCADARDARALDSASSKRILLQAVQAREAVRVLISVGGIETPATGRLEVSDASTLLVELFDPKAVGQLWASATALHVMFDIGNNQYVFETNVVEEPGGTAPGRLRLHRPKTLMAIERRRSTRTPLRNPAPVTLNSTGDDGSWQCSGDIFNVSPEGMACRVRESDAAILTKARKVRAVFRIGHHPQAFDLACRITNVTQGGTAERVVLGMGFVVRENPPETSARIQTALDSAV